MPSRDPSALPYSTATRQDMDCNRDDAIRSKEIAERKFIEKDIAGSKKFALKAKALFEPLEGIDQMISALDVHIRAQTKIDGENDWYGILEVSDSDDDDKIKRQYKRLALQTHPDKNSFKGAEGAFKLISDAWSVLSDKDKRRSYDQKRFGGSSGVHQNSFQQNGNDTSSSTMPGMNGFFSQNSGPAPTSNTLDTFWTSCSSCRMSFQYTREHINRYLICLLCQKMFRALETPPPTAPVYHNVGNHPMGLNTNTDGTQGTGGACGRSQNRDPMQHSFFRYVGGAWNSRQQVQQTHGPARKVEATEANVARSEDATVKEHEQAGSSLGSSNSAAKDVLRKRVARKETEAANKGCINHNNKVAGQSTSSAAKGDSGPQMHPAKRRRSNSSLGTSGEKGRTSFGKVLLQLGPEIRGLKMEKTKLQIRDKLEEFKSRRANAQNKRNVYADLEKKEENMEVDQT
ncbi:hypothetical protein GUJ93_ZPchr0001g30819 [Zizania palustris]|uniref:J domain-containing protein n=1 Tax=Zizania palustris TaxID=103762 RepID=A0A8J5RTK2_ZIZPA|nr:hypothetical protein GUJ93_ZPchr0001g30819 [Zizania palustris]